jgi:hypothetical protein
MKTFEAAIKAMIDEDRELGHIGVDDPEWGRYESMLRAALLVVQKDAHAGLCAHVIGDILKGKA